MAATLLEQPLHIFAQLSPPIRLIEALHLDQATVAFKNEVDILNIELRIEEAERGVVLLILCFLHLPPTSIASKPVNATPRSSLERIQNG